MEPSGLSNTSGDRPGERLMRATFLEGNAVYNRSNEHLGEITEVILDMPHGRIAYAVMSSGGVLGAGEKMFALPWGALTLDTERECFILDADKARMDQAPGFDEEHWPELADDVPGTGGWERDVHSYYRTRPYWEV